MNTVKKTKLLVVFAFAWLISSCNSKQWKETVETTVHLKSSNSHVYFGPQHNLEMDTLTVTVKSFALEGKRIQAEEIFLTNEAQYTASQIGGTGVFNTSLDIPQGTYESLQFTTELNGQNSLSIRGIYEGPLGIPTRVEIDLESSDFFIRPLLDNVEESISVDKNVPRNISISIDTDSLLADVSPGLWTAAVATNIGGQQVIQISSTQNANMYSAILGRLNESFNCEIE